MVDRQATPDLFAAPAAHCPVDQRPCDGACGIGEFGCPLRGASPHETRAGKPPRDHGIAPYASRAARRAAWDAWIAQGSPWPPPPGLTSASLDTAMRRPGREGFRR